MAQEVNAKYVVILNPNGFTESIVVFPRSMNHSTFAHMNPISAGFITWDEESGWQTFGSSVSLDDLESRPEDSELASIYLNSRF